MDANMSGPEKVILKERARTHGPYDETARLTKAISQPLVLAIMKNKKAHDEVVTIFTVDNIAHKLARIGCGDPDEIDHWRDIAGYATRQMEFLQKCPGRA